MSADADDAAIRAVQRLRQSSTPLASTLPTAPNGEAAPRAQLLPKHTYRPRRGDPEQGARTVTRLRIPKVLLRGSDGELDADAAQPVPPPPSRPSPPKAGVRSRAEAARPWLAAAEAGCTPGPNYRDMAATQKVRRFGPDALLLGGKLEVAVSQETLESSPQLGLTPAPDAAQPLPSSFLPLEVFDNPETMEPLLLETWHHLSETPVSARSRFRSTSGDTSWEPCTVIRHDPASGTFTIRWGSGRTKQVTRLNLQFDTD